MPETLDRLAGDIASRSPRELPQHAPKSSSWGVFWLIAVFLVGCVFVIELHRLIGSLIVELNQKSANEGSRQLIGEELVNSLNRIEKDFYQMAVTTGPMAQEGIGQEIAAQAARVRHCLEVLQNGGTVERVVGLNLKGQEEMMQPISYQPAADAADYVMEVDRAGSPSRPAAAIVGATAPALGGLGPGQAAWRGRAADCRQSRYRAVSQAHSLLFSSVPKKTPIASFLSDKRVWIWMSSKRNWRLSASAIKPSNGSSYRWWSWRSP